MTSKTDKVKEEELGTGQGTLPAGHPQAGYVSPDLSERSPAGALPPEEQEWHDARDEAQQAEVETVLEHEQNVAKLEQDPPHPEQRDEKAAQRDEKTTTAK